MGPRQDAGEDLDTLAAKYRLPLASMGPRQDAGEDDTCPDGFAATISALQWGPGRMPGKTLCLSKIKQLQLSASMGPRQDAGEDGGKLIAMDVTRQRFNGAPAGCRGRHDQC